MSRRRKNQTDSDDKDESSHGKNRGLALLFVIILVLAGVGAAATYWMMGQPSGGYISTGDNEGGPTPNSGSGSSENPTTVIDAQLSVKYAPLSYVSKKVIGELFVTTTCPYCARTEGDLKHIEKERNDFYFVSFVADKNQEAYGRYNEISKKQGTPDTEFDGGYKAELGAVDPVNFVNDIKACKERSSIPAEIQAHVLSESGGKASLSIEVRIGNRDFNGNIKAFVIDKNSPWKNVDQESIPNAFVGYLLNGEISLSNGNIERTGQWKVDGTKSFSELAVVIAIYDSHGYAVQAYRIDL